MSLTFWTVAFACANAGAADRSMRTGTQTRRRIIRASRKRAGGYQNDAHARVTHRTSAPGAAGHRARGLARSPSRGSTPNERSARWKQGDVRSDRDDEEREIRTACLG